MKPPLEVRPARVCYACGTIHRPHDPAAPCARCRRLAALCGDPPRVNGGDPPIVVPRVRQ